MSKKLFMETGMVKPVEIFLSYVAMPNGSTLYQQLEANKFKALPQFTT